MSRSAGSHRLGLANRLVANGTYVAAADELARELLAAPLLSVRAHVWITRMLSLERAERALLDTTHSVAVEG